MNTSEVDAVARADEVQGRESLRPHYVAVDVLTDEAGVIRPKAVYWDDGRIFAIDEVLRVRPMRMLKKGRRLCGTRFTVRIGKTSRELYHDGLRWYVEVPSE